VLKLIVDCCSKRERKIPTKGKWPILKCIALSTKIYFASQTLLQVFLLTMPLPKITKEGLQEAEGLEEEAKVSSFLWLSAFPLELVPLQLLHDHRDGDAETLGWRVLQLPSNCPRRPSGCCTCRIYLKKKNRFSSNTGSEHEREIQMRIKVSPPITTSGSCGVRVRHNKGW
jgi:hypothetical protein